MEILESQIIISMFILGYLVFLYIINHVMHKPLFCKYIEITRIKSGILELSQESKDSRIMLNKILSCRLLGLITANCSQTPTVV